MLTFIAHLGTFYYHLHVLSYIKNIDSSKYNDQAIREFKELTNEYFTIWCFWTQTILFGICILHDIVRLTAPKSWLRRLLYSLKNHIFTSLAGPVALTVSITFWILWTIDRELVMPTVMDKIIPTWLNHALHTAIVCLVFVELLAERQKVPSLCQSVLLHGIYVGAYLFVFFYEYAQSGRWIYPLFAVLDWPGRITFCIGIIVSTFTLMAGFRKIVRVTWAEEHRYEKLHKP